MRITEAVLLSFPSLPHAPNNQQARGERDYALTAAPSVEDIPTSRPRMYSVFLEKGLGFLPSTSRLTLSHSLPLVFRSFIFPYSALIPVSYTHLRAHETPEHLVCRLLLEKKKKKKYYIIINNNPTKKINLTTNKNII
eukprot:TRINITY_DN44148_c0_g1_i1.p1 TRINITY_DN44148_c0_g1~~TRINITY_DN44148_c0_g1_i1.p1  ORF type:complete len:138 (+),score=12.32 TRINITY_DN44148_c0_g1_i1:338-751(+)